jgi:hypothetical protein
MDRWGQYFKPAGMGQATGDPNKASTPRVSAPVQTPVAETAEEEAPWEAPAAVAPAAPAPSSSGTSSKAQDILAAIRARQNAS